MFTASSVFLWQLLLQQHGMPFTLWAINAVRSTMPIV
jgi:hypothetical protein